MILEEFTPTLVIQLSIVFFKLRDEQIIMPLGKGRSARWMKIISENDPRLIFGLNYENKD